MPVDSYHADIWWITPNLTKAEPDFHATAVAWIKSLGLDPDRLSPTAGIGRFDGVYELHVDEVLRAANGYDRVDPLDEHRLLTVRRIIPVEEGTWPAMPREDIV